MQSVLTVLALVWVSSAVGVFWLVRKEMRREDLPRADALMSVRSVRYAGDGGLTELGSQNAHIPLVHAEERVEEIAN